MRLFFLFLFLISFSVSKKINFNLDPLVSEPEYLLSRIYNPILIKVPSFKGWILSLGWVDFLMRSGDERGRLPEKNIVFVLNHFYELEPQYGYGFYLAGVILSVVESKSHVASEVFEAGLKVIRVKQQLTTSDRALLRALYKAAIYNALFEEGDLKKAQRLVDELQQWFPQDHLRLKMELSTDHGRDQLVRRILESFHSQIRRDEIQKKLLRFRACLQSRFVVSVSEKMFPRGRTSERDQSLAELGCGSLSAENEGGQLCSHAQPNPTLQTSPNHRIVYESVETRTP